MDLNLGIVSDEISKEFREAVRVGLSCGIRRYELRYLQTGRLPVCDEAELREVERIVDGEGITITGLSPGLFKYAQSVAECRRETADILPRSLDIAERFGLSDLIVFSLQKPNATEENGDLISSLDPPSFVIDGLREAAGLASGRGIRLLIESEPICWADTALATAGLITRIGSEYVGVNYDPSNLAWAERRDPIADFQLLSAFIGNVHIKNHRPASRGSGMPEWIVPDQGVLDLGEHLAALHAISYKGPISLEPHINNPSADVIQRCKDAVEALWSRAAHIDGFTAVVSN